MHQISCQNARVGWRAHDLRRKVPSAWENRILCRMVTGFVAASNVVKIAALGLDLTPLNSTS
jgi:hypothetical protein